jgi:ABC-type branched-subunit amino acid transport system ATPase component
VTLVVIEHDMRFLFGLADRISVVHWGQVIARGTPGAARQPVGAAARRWRHDPRDRRHRHLLRRDAGALRLVAGRRRGEVVALLGANGAGKTTTLRSILGLTRPRRGRIAFDGWT